MSQALVIDKTGADLTLRCIPHHHWLRFAISVSGRCEPGHDWLYCDLVRRDAWRIGRLGFVIMRMPIKGRTTVSEHGKLLIEATSLRRETDRLRAELAQAHQRIADLEAERDRLRARIHEAVDEANRRFAPVQAEHDRMRNLMHEALAWHNREMERLGLPDGVHISSYGQAAAANILAQRDEARADLERALKVVQAAEAWHEQFCASYLPPNSAEGRLLAAVDLYREGRDGS